MLNKSLKASYSFFSKHRKVLGSLKLKIAYCLEFVVFHCLHVTVRIVNMHEEEPVHDEEPSLRIFPRAHDSRLRMRTS